MRQLLLTVGSLLVFLLSGCGNSKVDIEELQARWSKRLSTEMPVGTSATVVRQWFQDQGIKVETNSNNSSEMRVWLGSIKAREWFCEKWWVDVTVKVSPKGEVTAYEFGSIGTCL